MLLMLCNPILCRQPELVKDLMVAAEAGFFYIKWASELGVPLDETAADTGRVQGPRHTSGCHRRGVRRWLLRDLQAPAQAQACHCLTSSARSACCPSQICGCAATVRVTELPHDVKKKTQDKTSSKEQGEAYTLGWSEVRQILHSSALDPDLALLFSAGLHLSPCASLPSHKPPC